MAKNITILGAVAALLLAPALASAADMPMKAAPVPVPVYDWTGFYIGAAGGGSIGNSDHIDVATGLSDALGYNIHGWGQSIIKATATPSVNTERASDLLVPR